VDRAGDDRVGNDLDTADADARSSVTLGAPLPTHPEPSTPSRDALRQRHRAETAWLASAWRELELWHYGVNSSPAAEVELAEYATLARKRRDLLRRVADYTAPTAPSLADELRRSLAIDVRAALRTDHAHTVLEPGHGAAVRADLDRVTAAMDAVTTSLADAASRCAWAEADITIRLDRISAQLGSRAILIDMRNSNEEPAETRQEARDWLAIQRVFLDFERLATAWRESPQRAAADVRRAAFPDVSILRTDWTTAQRQLEVAERTCGWRG
jgi:hypothetical protein